MPVVVGERGAEYSSVLESIALERGSSITFADDCYRIVRSGYDVDSLQYVDLQGLRDGALCRYELDLVGGYQQHNLKSLLSAIDLINSDSNILLSIPPRAIADGLRRVVEATSLKGRWQTLSRSPRIVCDTGHNEAGIREVAQQLLRESYNRLICILGFTAEKDLRKLLPLLPAEAHYIFTRAKGERSMALAKIEEVARELGLSYDLESDVEEALCRGRGLVGVDDLLFVGGSTFVVAEVSGLTF